MIVVNITLSFADAIQEMAIDWLKNEYMPLLKSCPCVANTALFSVETQQGADDCFALQIQFSDSKQYGIYKEKYEHDFEAALFAKFTNQFGMFKTVLTSL
ncbi:MAG: DUF4286 family protein [Bacteroidales bacterium]|nr:DUF4286 family protein [Bacteroidales bacterium]